MPGHRQHVLLQVAHPPAEGGLEAHGVLGVGGLADGVEEADPRDSRMHPHHQGRGVEDERVVPGPGEDEVFVGTHAHRAGDHQRGVGEQRSDAAFEALRVGPVVGVEAGEELRIRLSQSGIAGAVGATVDGFADDAHAWVHGLGRRENSVHRLRGGVVDDEQFPVGVGLLDAGADGSDELRVRIEGAHDDGDQGPANAARSRSGRREAVESRWPVGQ